MAATITTVGRGSVRELRQTREAAGLTRAQLAGLADCSMAFIANVEQGYVPKRSPTLEHIFDVLNDVANDERPPGEAGAVTTSAGQGRHSGP
jgi:predicted transcriptional regulator